MDPLIPDIFLIDHAHEDVTLIQFFIKYQLIDRLFQMKDYESAFNYLFTKQRAEMPRLLIIDLLNEEWGNGVNLIKQIKAQNELKNIPMVVTTDSQSESKIIELYRLSVSNTIVKPVNLIKFKKIVSLAGINYDYFNQFQDTDKEGT